MLYSAQSSKVIDNFVNLIITFLIGEKGTMCLQILVSLKKKIIFSLVFIILVSKTI